MFLDLSIEKVAVIVIVALVVLGPERLPEVMRTVGGFYRQARALYTQLTGEAQTFMNQSMQELQSATAPLQASIESAMAEEPAPPPPPPPPLLHVAPALDAPKTAADAGPAVLPAPYRPSRPEEDPPIAASYTAAASPAALPLLAPRLEAALPAFDDLDALLDAEPGSAASVPTLPAHPADDTAHTPVSRRPAEQAAQNEPAPESRSERASEGEDQQDGGVSVRTKTAIELYRGGALTVRKAAAFLKMTPAEFQQLIDADESPAAQQAEVRS